MGWGWELTVQIPLHGCKVGPGCQGVFQNFAEIKELLEGAYSSFMVGQSVCVAKDYSASHKSIRTFQSENQNCAPSDPITGGRA